MATKSKNYKPFKSWLCFVIGLNILALVLGIGLAYYEEMDWAMLGSDFQETEMFHQEMGHKFHTLAMYITDNLEDYYGPYYPESGMTQEEWKWDTVNSALRNGFIDEGENLIYYAKNPKEDLIFTNAEDRLDIGAIKDPTLPKGYNYYILFDGEEFKGQKNGKPIDIYTAEKGYRRTALYGFLEESTDTQIIPGFEKPPKEKDEENPWYETIKGTQIFLGVKEKPVETPYSGSLYNIQSNMKWFKGAMAGVTTLMIAGFSFLIYAMINRRARREFTHRIGALLGRIFLEFKIIGNIVVFVIGIGFLGIYYWNEISVILLAGLLGFWWLYIFWLDIRTNGLNILRHNIINGIIKAYRKYEMKKPLEKGLILRTYIIIGVAILGTAFTLLFLIISFQGGSGVHFIISLVILGLSLYLLNRYLKRHRQSVTDIGRIVDQTHRIKEGDYDTKLNLSPYGDFYFLGENLNAIQKGVASALEEKLKSERMKVELITNVSHDLKTPLTSIISYGDLLLKEEGLPSNVNDYIKVLNQKSQRLKLLIQDLFDLSKAVSGEMELEIKTIDIGKLIRQTLGDMEDDIKKSGIAIRTNVLEEPVYIESDGNKLYRVFQNLIQNALKYSLVGTRIYIDLIMQGPEVMATIKNTANYEMDFREEDIIERFVRGDKARSGEGSGLGLAIAENFTKACGGNLGILVDGDLFKVTLTFNMKNSE